MTKEKPLNLSEVRKEIDALDCQIQELINCRATLADTVAKAKSLSGPIKSIDFYRPEREADVLRGVLKRNKGPLSDDEILRLFREIMSACLAQQEPLKIAYLGPEGTFTQSAAIKHFGHSIKALPIASIEDVFHHVGEGLADFGIVPVENTSEGPVHNTLDMFLSSELKICGEVELRVHQNLLAKTVSLTSITRVYSHQQSLAQCRGWLHKHLPHAEKIPVSSNAEAARRASLETDVAAIASEAAAEIYRLKLVAERIEDKQDNTTRFLVLGRNLFPPSGVDKTSLILSAQDQPGLLYSLLKPLADHDVTMTRIESRPSQRGKWDYVFFIDVDGHAEVEPLKSALVSLKPIASLIKVLGSYPSAIL